MDRARPAGDRRRGSSHEENMGFLGKRSVEGKDAG